MTPSFLSILRYSWRSITKSRTSFAGLRITTLASPCAISDLRSSTSRSTRPSHVAHRSTCNTDAGAGGSRRSASRRGFHNPCAGAGPERPSFKGFAPYSVVLQKQKVLGHVSGRCAPPTIIAQRPLRPHGSPALGDGGQGLHVTLPPDPSRVVPQHMPSEGWHWAPINPEVEQSFAAPPRHTPPTHMSPLSAVHRLPSSQRDPSERVCPVHTPA